MSDKIDVVHCAWLVRCGQDIQANQRLTIVNGILQEICDVPADEQSLVQPITVLPALVNAHTHLEFSNLQAPLPPPSPFPDWIRSVVKYRQAGLTKPSRIQEAVVSGYTECQTTGTSVIGEICTSDAGRDAMIRAVADAGRGATSSVCFRELLGFTAGRVAQQQQIADDFVSRWQRSKATCADVVAGLSPHAPYSVHPDIVLHACELSKKHDLPIAMHLAETKDEVELIESKQGRFVDFLDSLRLWQVETLAGISKIADYLAMLKTASSALAIHANYLDDTDVRLLAESANITTVYCVRTHQWFGHTKHPWQQIEAAGGRVILGTDSRASNSDLSIWKELQTFCRLNQNESIIKRLPMISTHAAQALGLNPASVNLEIGTRFRAAVAHTPVTMPSQLESSLMQPSLKIHGVANGSQVRILKS